MLHIRLQTNLKKIVSFTELRPSWYVFWQPCEHCSSLLSLMEVQSTSSPTSSLRSELRWHFPCRSIVFVVGRSGGPPLQEVVEGAKKPTKDGSVEVGLPRKQMKFGSAGMKTHQSSFIHYDSFRVWRWLEMFGLSQIWQFPNTSSQSIKDWPCPRW